MACGDKSGYIGNFDETDIIDTDLKKPGRDEILFYLTVAMFVLTVLNFVKK